MVSKLASKAFPGFSRVYYLDEGRDRIAFRGRISLDDSRAVTRAEYTPPGPVEVRWEMGRKRPSDIVYTTSVDPVLISDRIVGILKASELSGWKTYPVDLFGKDGHQISGYQGLAVHGRCGPIDNSQSVRIDKIYPGGIFPRWRGLYFDPMTWDGSDLFMPTDSSGWIFAVDAVKQAFEKAKVTNVQFKPLDEIDRSEMEMKLAGGR